MTEPGGCSTAREPSPRGRRAREARAREAEPWSFLLASGRDAFRLRALLPVWLSLTAIVSAEAGLPEHLGWLASLAAAGAAFVLVPWISLIVLGGLRGASPPPVRDHVRIWARSVGLLALAAAGILATAALLLALGAAGTAVARMPLVGGVLGDLWTWTGALVLALLASAWLVVGVPALTLLAPAAAVDGTSGYELVTRTTSYVRREPLLFLAGWATVVFGAVLGTLAFAGFLALGLAAVECFRDLAGGQIPDIPRAATATLALCASPGTWWPFGFWEGSPPAVGPAGVPFRPPLAIARLAPAFLATALAAGACRLYLALRYRVDGTPIAEDDRCRTEAPRGDPCPPRDPAPAG